MYGPLIEREYLASKPEYRFKIPITPNQQPTRLEICECRSYRYQYYRDVDAQY